jgi:RNA-directed DNA polymerase
MHPPHETRWGAGCLISDSIVNPASRRLFECLAAHILVDGLTSDSVEQACKKILGPFPQFARRLAARLKRAFPGARPPARQLEKVLSRDRPLRRLLERIEPRALEWRTEIPRMAPAGTQAKTWTVPAIVTEGDLAAWLDIEAAALLWFSDLRNWEGKAAEGPLRHYRRRWMAKPSGARLLEAPKPRLKGLQRKILTDLLSHIPPHEAAHGFRPGRSIVTFAEPHCRQAMVIRLDLRDFFLTISRARIAAIFRTAGYPERVATLLAGLCCTVTPADALDQRPGGPPDWLERKAFAVPHLPQGAPTSPALANLCAFRLDSRLAGLARSAGATYTRYADDLTFSGGPDFARKACRFEITAAAIALEEGFSVNHRKTRIMSQALSQRTAGLVVNERVAIPRRDFETLKAILHNCATHGPTSQNRTAHPDFRAHLAGRLAQLKSVNPHRAARLQSVWDRIRWES